ncbi:MAG: hypothetical protein U0361_19945 [Nitrospiraceae bacterium]
MRTHSKSAVVGGIVTIAIADALDALGIHIAEESKNNGRRWRFGRPRSPLVAGLVVAPVHLLSRCCTSCWIKP